MRELVEFFQNKKVASVLDVGCGGGDFVKVLSGVFPEETKITGIDPYDAPLREARKRFSSKNIQFEQMSSEQMNFSDETFDVVSISFALHHLSDIPKTLNEMKRAVKPNGWLIINEIISEVQNEAQENHKMFHHFKSFTDRLDGVFHRETYTKEEVLDLVRSNGIKVSQSFLNLKMKEPSFEPDFLEWHINRMEDQLEILKRHGVYEEKKASIAEIEKRIREKGIQIAPSIVIIGQKA